MSQTSLEGLIADGRSNAVVAWLLIAVIALIGVASLLTGGILWSTFAATLVLLALFPPIAFRSPLTMLPWEVLLLAALPVLGVTFGTERLTGHATSYLSVAAIALVLAVELQAFTPVRMTPGFAVAFVAVATMAAAALWALFRWSVAGVFGVPFPTDHDDVMWEFVYSAVSGLGAGIVFEAYFRRLDNLERSRLSDGPAVSEGDDAEA